MSMDTNQEPKDDQDDQEFSFLQETIKKEPMNRKKVVKRTLTVAVLGLVFGLFASLGFCALKPWAEKHFPGNTTPVTIPRDEEPEQAEQEDAQSEAVAPVLDVTSYRELYSGLYQIAAKTNKSVVTVIGIHGDEGWIEHNFDAGNTVSGLIVADTGQELLVLTETTILKDAKQLKVEFIDGNKCDASLKKKDTNLGLAMLSIPRSQIAEVTWSQIQVANLGNSNLMTKGNPVIVLGSPFGYADGLGYGVISSATNLVPFTDGDYKILATDIAVTSNGTGILANLSGEVVGIVSQKLSTEESMNLVTGLAVSDLKEVIERLSNGTSVPYIGIKGTKVTEEVAQAQELPTGVYVKEVVADSPAMAAGIQSGDILTKVDKSKVNTVVAYHSALMGHNTGDEIIISGKRLGQDGYVDIEFSVMVGSSE